MSEQSDDDDVIALLREENSALETEVIGRWRSSAARAGARREHGEGTDEAHLPEQFLISCDQTCVIGNSVTPLEPVRSLFDLHLEGFANSVACPLPGEPEK